MLLLLNQIQSNNSEVEAVVPTIFSTFLSQAILNASGPINWALINETQFNSTLFEGQVTLGGFDFREIPADRFNGVIFLNNGTFPTNPNQIILDNATANRLNIQVGGNVTLGLFTSTGGTYYVNPIPLDPICAQEANVENFTRDINLTVAGTFIIQNYVRLNALINPGPNIQTSLFAGYNNPLLLANFTTMQQILTVLTPSALVFPQTNYRV